MLWYGDLKARIRKQNGVLYTAFVALISAVFTVLCMQMLGLTTLRVPLVVRSAAALAGIAVVLISGANMFLSLRKRLLKSGVKI